VERSSHLCVFACIGSEQATREVFSEVKELLSSVVAELYHRIAALNNYIAIRVHAEGSNNVYERVYIGS